jgi:hypothetical protein
MPPLLGTMAAKIAGTLGAAALMIGGTTVIAYVIARRYGRTTQQRQAIYSAAGAVGLIAAVVLVRVLLG